MMILIGIVFILLATFCIWRMLCCHHMCRPFDKASLKHFKTSFWFTLSVVYLTILIKAIMLV